MVPKIVSETYPLPRENWRISVKRPKNGQTRPKTAKRRQNRSSWPPTWSLPRSALFACRLDAQNTTFYYVFLAHQGPLPDIETQRGTVRAAIVAGQSPLAGDKRGYNYPLGGCWKEKLKKK